MRFLELFDVREWEPLDFRGLIVDGKLSDQGVVWGCFLAAGLVLAFGA